LGPKRRVGKSRPPHSKQGVGSVGGESKHKVSLCKKLVEGRGALIQKTKFPLQGKFYARSVAPSEKIIVTGMGMRSGGFKRKIRPGGRKWPNCALQQSKSEKKKPSKTEKNKEPENPQLRPRKTARFFHQVIKSSPQNGGGGGNFKYYPKTVPRAPGPEREKGVGGNKKKKRSRQQRGAGVQPNGPRNSNDRDLAAEKRKGNRDKSKKKRNFSQRKQQSQINHTEMLNVKGLEKGVENRQDPLQQTKEEGERGGFAGELFHTKMEYVQPKGTI